MTSPTGFKFCHNQNYPDIPDGNSPGLLLDKRPHMVQKLSGINSETHGVLVHFMLSVCQPLIEVLSSCQQTMSAKPKSIKMIPNILDTY